MGYAVRNDGLGWRAVNNSDDVLETETYSENQPAPIQPSANEEIKARIVALDAQITPRMISETLSGSTETFAPGTPYAGKTAAQAIAAIVDAKAALRAQLK